MYESDVGIFCLPLRMWLLDMVVQFFFKKKKQACIFVFCVSSFNADQCII